MSYPQILVTGGNGFVGSFLKNYFLESGYSITCQVRQLSKAIDSLVKQVSFDITKPIDETIFRDIDVCVHCAARAHVMNEVSENPIEIYRKINVEGALNVAKAAAKAGVKRFIFLSSIKVNGEFTTKAPFSANDPVLPTDPYGLSKYEAEQALLAFAKESGMDVVVIRPVLIYGPNVKANFQSMVQLANKGIPLPVGCLDNKRSMVSIYNLANFIELCLTHPAAKNEIFLVSDQDDLTVKELFIKLAETQDKTLIALPFPKVIMFLLAKLFGQGAVVSRLCSSLVVDTEKNKNLLNWKAPYSVEQSLKLMFRKVLD